MIKNPKHVKTMALSIHLPPHVRARSLLIFAAFSWLHMLTVTWTFYRFGHPEPGLDPLSVFHLAVWAAYSLIYLLPGLLLAVVGHLARLNRHLVAGVAVVATGLCLLLIRADSAIYDLYNFHFNGFVVNLLLTPGGVQSLGGENDTYLTIAAIAAWHLLLQGLAWFLAERIAIKVRMPTRWGLVAAILIAIMLGERIAYGFADIRDDGRFLEAAKVYPLYGRTKFRTLAAKFGVTPTPRQQQLAVAMDSGRLNYPADKVVFSPVENPPNLVILVAESLRWDRLTPKIMPNTWHLAQEGQHFTHHYSSGNGTREGLFGLFYGLYGSYWSSFLYAHKSPLLMDRLQELNYQFDLRTSARFSYPEFDQTLFARIPATSLHQRVDGEAAWEMDRDNADALIEFLRTRDRNRPFMSFFFLESTHARYTFPDSAAIATPYLANVNYASMSRESLIPQIDQLLNRYTNAAHWVDIQLGRIYAELEQQDLLKNTILIVTGDHGEEFMEKGAWGHNSSFVDEQTRTPMVMRVPGREPRQIDEVSSHLDIGTTLLQFLGAPKEADSYSLGRNLFDISNRPYVVSSDWHSINLITPDMKYRIPYTNRGADQWVPTDRSDTPYVGNAIQDVLQKNNQLVLNAIKNCSKFVKVGKRRA